MHRCNLKAHGEAKRRSPPFLKRPTAGKRYCIDLPNRVRSAKQRCCRRRSECGTTAACGSAGNRRRARCFAGRRYHCRITTKPGLFAGNTISITGTVEEIFTPWSFKVDKKQELSANAGNDLVILGAAPLEKWEFDKSLSDKKARITGTVRILQAEDIRREYGRGVDDLLFRRFEGKPAIVAQSVEQAG